jgi:hypothetical protein
MLLDDLSYKDSIDRILEMRTNVIRDVIHKYNKTAGSANHRVTHQLREVTSIIKRTLQQMFDIFYSKENHNSTLIESYVVAFQKTFLIPSNSSHGNETPSQSAITRLFSPSSNVHLIVRYLPETIQNYLPEFEPAPVLKETEIQILIQQWLEQIESILKEKLPETLSAIQNQNEIIQIRTKLWELLDEDENTKDKNNAWQKATQSLLGKRYSIWDSLYRDVFNNQSKLMINTELLKLSNQPESIVWTSVTDPNKPHAAKKDFALTMKIWPGVNSKQQMAFSLPSFSSSKEISNFKASLTETANDRTDVLYKLQDSFDTCLSKIRKDVQAHHSNFEHDNFNVKE